MSAPDSNLLSSVDDIDPEAQYSKIQPEHSQASSEYDSQVIEQQGEVNNDMQSNPTFGTSVAAAAANGLLILSTTAAITNGKAPPSPVAAPIQFPNPHFSFFFPQAYAAASAGLDPYAAMSTQLASMARMGQGLTNFPNLLHFPSNMLQDAALAANAAIDRESASNSGRMPNHDRNPENMAGEEFEDFNPTKEGKFVCPTCNR
ncbi:hypothetical protein HK096_002792, partial [Nowakowskiella sp. JEL0078]